jgi:uroporphyrinogen decarboxylase
MNETFLKACRGEEVDYTPVWIMRQAGRSIPEYNELNKTTDFMGLCKSPELAARITTMPHKYHGVDACVLFSDMPTAVMPMGAELYYDPVKGPIYPEPIRSASDVAALKVPDPEVGLPFVMDTIRMLKPELADKVPLIGFAGCPFTLGAYMVEGGVSSRYFHAKSMINEAPEVFHALMKKVADFDAAYCQAQLDNGVNALMLFESWGGVLSAPDYEEFAYPYVKQVIDTIKGQGKPIIYFMDKGSSMLELARDSGADVVQVDFRIHLDKAVERLGQGVSVQGNLDPYVLLAAPQDVMEARVKDVLARGSKARGHIFNLGDGIQPETSMERAKALVDAVHKFSRK